MGADGDAVHNGAAIAELWTGEVRKLQSIRLRCDQKEPEALLCNPDVTLDLVAMRQICWPLLV